jgi:hypothetical protein
MKGVTCPDGYECSDDRKVRGGREGANGVIAEVTGG